MKQTINESRIYNIQLLSACRVKSMHVILIVMSNLFFMSLPSEVLADIADVDYTWTGAINTDWNNAGNWTPAGFTGSIVNDNVIIPVTANQPVVSGSSSCKQILSLAGITISGSGALTIGNIAGIVSVTGTATISCNLIMPTKVDITNESDLTISGIISGATLEFNKFGAGTLTLTGVNTYTGATNISSGLVSVATIGNGGTPGNLGAATSAVSNLLLDGGTLQYTGPNATTDRGFTLASAKTSAFDIASNTLTISGGSAISTGTLNKIGAGTLIVTGSNLYTGGTLISDGTFAIGASERISNASALTIAIGATFDLGGFSETVGSLAGNGTVTSSATGNPTLIAGGDNTSTTFGGLIQDGSISPLSITKAGTGTLSLSTTNTYSGVTTINGGTLSISIIGNGGVAGNIGQASNASSNLVMGGGTLQYTGASSSTDRGFTLTGATTSILDLTTNDFNISGIITGGGSLIKNGIGTLVLTGTNTYTGVTRINAGIVSIATLGNGGISGNLGQASSASANLVLSGGVLVYNGVTASSDRGVTLGASSTSFINIVASNLTISGIVVGPANGNISKIGAGTLTLSGTNTYTGITSIDEGILSIGTFGNSGTPSNIGAASNAAANLVLNGGTLQYTGATASTTRSYTLANATTSVIDVTTNNLTISGSAAATSGALTKTGNGKLTLSGTNSYTGTTLITAGVLNTQRAQGTGTNANGVIVSSGTALEIEGGISVLGEALSLNNAGVAGTGAFRNISGANSWSGAINLEGPSRINSDAGSLNLSGGITGNGGGLTIGGAGGTTISASGINTSTGGTLTKDGSGTLTISSAGSYTGSTGVNAGILNIQDANATGTIAGGVSVATGAALQMQANISVGAEALNLSGTGIGNDGVLRNISGINTWGGLITLGSNTQIRSDAGTLSLDVNTGNAVTGSFNLNIDGAGNTTIADPIATSTGSLTKSGSGTLILSGVNTYTGGTSITSGTLILDASGVLADAGGVSMDGGILRTGSSVGFNETVNTLDLNSNSTIALGTGVHILSFAPSNGVTWTNGTMLTITGWTGGYDGTASATAGRIFVGINVNGLTAAQVAQIQFFDGINNLPAKILSDGEVVPAGKAYYAIGSGNWNVSSTWSLTTGGAAASTFPTGSDIVYIGESVTAVDIVIPAGYSASCANLTIGNSTTNTLAGTSLSLGSSTSFLNVLGPIILNRPAGNLINAFHIGDGTVTVGGDLTLDGTANNFNRIARMDMSAGTLTITGSMIFNTNATAGVATNVFDISGGAGTVNLGGGFILTNNIGTLIPGTTSTFNFNGSSVQTIPIGVSNVVYNHLSINNTSTSGATISAAISAIRVTGNISIGNLNTGSLFNTNNLTVSIAASKSLTIALNSTINAGSKSISFGSSPPNPAAIINGVFKTTNTISFSGTTGGSINTINSPVLSLGPNSLIDYSASVTQSVSQRTDYANMTLTGGSKTISTGTITLSKTLTINSGATYNGASNPTLNIGGDFINNGTFIQGTGIVSFNGSETQTIGGSVNSDFNSLTINKSSGGVILTTNPTINGALTLTSGIFDGFTNNKTVTISASGSASSASNASHISGKLARIYSGIGSKNFPIGKGGNAREVILNYTSLTGTSTVTAEQFESTIPGTIPALYTAQPGRHWDISQSGGTSYVYDITLDGSSFVPGVEDAFVLKGDGINNTASLASFSDPNFTTTGLNTFSKFAVAFGCLNPTISVQPLSFTSCLGDNVDMSVTANAVGTLTYQWYKVGVGSINDGGSITGTTTSTLHFNSVSAALDGTYYVIITRECSATAQSNNAILTVNSVIGGTGSSNQIICSGEDPTVLSVTGSSGAGSIGYQWLSGTTSCNVGLSEIPSATSATYDPPPGLTQTTYYKRRITSTLNSVVCQDLSSCITISVNQNPTTATVAVTPLNYCGTLISGSLGGNTALVGTGTWSIVSGGPGSFSNASNGSSTFTAAAYGTYILRWTISNAPCTSSSADVNVHYDETPTTATVGSTLNMCGALSSTSLGGNTPLVGTGAWSQVSGPGTTIFSTPSNGSSTATVTLYGAYDYRWTISNGTCTPSTADKTVNYYEQPIVTNQPNQTLCNTSAFTMTQSAPTVGTGLWTLINGTATISTPGSPGTAITGLVAGTNATVRWTVTNGTCNAFDDVTIQNDAQPVVSNQPNQTLCNTSNFTMTQSAPSVGTGLWTLINGTATITTPGSPTSTITSVVAGTNAIVRWTVTNGTCSAFDEVTVQNDVQPVVSNQPNQTLCNTSTFTMTQSAPNAGTGVWTLVNGAASITSAGSPATTITGVVAGTNVTVRWTVTNGTCSAFDEVTIQNDAQPIVSNQPDQTLCNTSTFTMTQSTPSVGTGTWTLVSGNGTITNPSSPTTTVTGVSAGTIAILRWTVTNGTCSAFDDVTLQNDIQPIVSNQPNQTLCNTSSFAMTQSTPSAGTGVWSLINGSAIISSPGSPTTIITGLTAGTSATVRWTVTNGTCNALDDVLMKNDVLPVVIDQPNQSACNTSSFTMTQSNPDVGTGLWTLISGSATITTPESPITTITDIVPGTSVTVRWTVTNGTCSPFDDVILKNDIQPTVSNQPNQTLCNTSVYSMTQSTPPVGTGLWTLLSGTATITTPGSPITTITGLATGTTATVRWTVTNGTCTAFDDVIIQNDILPSVSNQPNQNQCNTSIFSMTQSTPIVGLGIWTLVSGTASITNASDPLTTITGVPVGTNATVKWTVSNGTCSAFDNVTVQNDAQPTVSDQPNQTLCNTSTFTMTQSAPFIGIGTWSLVNGTANITDVTDPMTTITSVAAGTNVIVKWTVTNGTCSAFDNIIIQNDAQPIVSNQPNQILCNTSSSTMTQSTPNVGTGIWTLVSGIAIINTPTLPTTIISVVAPGTSATVKWTVSNGTCSAFDNVTIQNNILPVVSDQPDQTLCNTSSFTMTQSTPSVGTGFWTLVNGAATLTDPTDPGTSVTGVVAGTTATVRWTVTNGNCSAFDDVSLQNNAQPIVSNQPNQTLCNAASFTMTQTAPSVGTGIWTLVGGNATIPTPGSPTTSVTGIVAGTTATVKWTVTNGNCSAFDNVTLQNDLLPSVSDQPDQTLCNTSVFTMTQSAPSIGTGMWTLINGSATITDPTDPMTTVTGVLAGSSAVIRWTVSNGICNAFDNVAVHNDIQPIVSNQPNQILCNTSTFMMTQTAPITGTGMWTLVSGTAIITNPLDPITTVTGVAAGNSAIVRWTVSNGTCSAFDEVTLTNNLIVVSNLNDNGTGSLRDVVSCAPAGSIITFAPGLFGQTITLTSGEIEINKNVILSGLGKLDLTISGNNTSRIFHILPGNAVTIKNLGLKNALASSNGGAMVVEGNLTLENVLTQNNFENGLHKAMTILDPGSVEIIGNVEIKN